MLYLDIFNLQRILENGGHLLNLKILFQTAAPAQEVIVFQAFRVTSRVV